MAGAKSPDRPTTGSEPPLLVPELRIPPGLTVADLAAAAELVRQWADGDDLEGDATGLVVVAAIYELLVAVDRTRQPKV